MLTKESYADFQQQIFDELDSLEAPKARELILQLLKECGWEDVPLEDVKKRAKSVEDKYWRRVYKHSREHTSWPLERVMDDLRRHIPTAELELEAKRAVKIRKLLTQP